MSKYKRRSKGHQLKRPDFGDLGLRAYKNQQDTIIAAQKLANQDFKTKNRDWVSSEETRIIKEQQNRTELKKLEDDVYDVKFDATKLRAKREVEALEGEAQEYGRKAQFWKDFSTTYAQRFGQAAGEILGAVDRMKATANAHTYFNSPEYSQNLDIIDSLGNKLEQEKLFKVLEPIMLDKKISSNERAKLVAQHIDQKKRGVRGTESLVRAERLIKDWDKIKAGIDQAVKDNPNLTLTEDNIEIAYFTAIYTEMAEHGLQLNSKGAKKVLDFAMGKARDKKMVIRNGRLVGEANENSKALVDKYSAIKGNDSDTKIAKEIAFKDLVAHNIDKYEAHKTEGGVLVHRDPKQATLQALQDLLNDDVFNSKEELDEAANLPYAGQKMSQSIALKMGTDEDPRKGYLDRHPVLVDQLDVLWRDYNTSRITKDEEQFKSDQYAAVQTVKQQVRDGKLDPANSQQMAQTQLANPYPDVQEYLGKVSAFYPNQIASGSGAGINTSYVVTTKMSELYASKDTSSFSEIYNHYPPEIQEQFKPLMNTLLELDQNGFGSSKLKKRIKGYISKEIKLSGDQLIGASNATLDVADAMEQDFDNRISIAMQDEEDKRTPTQKITDTWEVVKQRFKDGEGPYRREGDGLDVKWLAFEKESELTAMPKETLEANLKRGEKGWDLILANVKNGTRLISQDAEDSLLNSIRNNKSIPQIDNIDTIYKIRNPNNSKNHISKTAILNEYLEARGLKQRVLPGPEDYAYYEAKNSRLVIKNYNSLSSQDKIRLHFLTEIQGDEDVPISKTLDPNSPDFFQNEIDKRNNYDYWNSPPIIPGLKYEEPKKLKNYYDNS